MQALPQPITRGLRCYRKSPQMLRSLHLDVALPELILAGGALVLLMLGVATRRERGELILWLAIILLALAGIFVASGEGTTTLFHKSFIVDPFARTLKLLTLAGAAVALLMSVDYWRGAGGVRFEFPVLVLLATTGMLMMISANDLIALYVGLEQQSLALYVVAAFQRDSARSSEAGLKYFVLGALSSGMLLYGASLVYGFTGSTGFDDIALAVQPSGANIGLIFGLVFLMAGFAFKISAVPFHMWTPDVYEGAPTPVTAFFAAAPKLAAMALTVRVLITAFPAVTLEWRQIVVFLAIASMALGSFAAIGQTNIKRLMAYSSIGHMGYALVGLAAGTTEGVQGVIIYLAIYLAMTLGTFACILAMRRDGRMVEDIDQLSGLSSTSPLMAFLLAMLLFSLAGVPPLAGFFAKFYVFLAAIHAGLYALAVIGVLLSVVGAYYYLRIVKIMYFDAPAERFEPMDTPLAAVLGVTGLFILLYFIYPAPLVAFAGAAATSLF
jgi:NADH-quinone oxidoreductase subunit N